MKSWELKEKINEMVAELMPEAMGGEFTKLFEKHQALKVDVEELSAKLKAVEQENEDLHGTLSKYEDLDSNRAELAASEELLDERERQITARENELTVEALRIKLEAERRISEALLAFTDKLVTRTTLKMTVGPNNKDKAENDVETSD